MQRLVIFGDEWSQGEWKLSDRKVLLRPEQRLEIGHSGMVEYLSDRFQVANFSYLGADNWTILNSLHHYFGRYGVIDNEKIIIFQHDPSCPYLAEKFNVSYLELYQNCTNIRQLFESTLEMFYIKLNELAVRENIKFYLCGTTSSLHTDLLKNFSNLVNLCTCWIELLDTSYTPDILPVLLSKDLSTICKQQERMDLYKEVINHNDQNFVYFTKLADDQYFNNPDKNTTSYFYPNRQAHLLMANHIKSFFDNEIKEVA